MDELEKLSMQYFANDNRPLSEKNAAFKIGLKKCNEFSDEAIADSGLNIDDTLSCRIGVAVGAGIGGIQTITNNQ